GYFAARGAHSNPDIAGGQSWGIVHSITHNGYLVTLGFDATNKLDFVLRQAFPFGFFTPDLAGHPSRDCLAITGNHGDTADATLFKLGQGFARLSAGLVLQTYPADALAPTRDKYQAPAFGFVQI